MTIIHRREEYSAVLAQHMPLKKKYMRFNSDGVGRFESRLLDASRNRELPDPKLQRDK
jgi:hypothetical protein